MKQYATAAGTVLVLHALSGCSGGTAAPHADAGTNGDQAPFSEKERLDRSIQDGEGAHVLLAEVLGTVRVCSPGFDGLVCEVPEPWVDYYEEVSLRVLVDATGSQFSVGDELRAYHRWVGTFGELSGTAEPAWVFLHPSSHSLVSDCIDEPVGHFIEPTYLAESAAASFYSRDEMAAKFGELSSPDSVIQWSAENQCGAGTERPCKTPDAGFTGNLDDAGCSTSP